MYKFNIKTIRQYCKLPAQKLLELNPGMIYVPEKDYYFQDNGSDILAVAHTDTVFGDGDSSFAKGIIHGKHILFSPAFDDRIGVYVACELLNKVYGLKYDILLTTGEEKAASSAMNFDTEKTYKWMFEFDRGGTDVVMYQYLNRDWQKYFTEQFHLKCEHGSYSDIADLEHLGCVGFNWGTGYENAHTSMCHLTEEDLNMMVLKFVKFYKANKELAFPFAKKAKAPGKKRARYYGGATWQEDWDGYYSGKGHYDYKRYRWISDAEAERSGWVWSDRLNTYEPKAGNPKAPEIDINHYDMVKLVWMRDSVAKKQGLVWDAMKATFVPEKEIVVATTNQCPKGRMIQRYDKVQKKWSWDDIESKKGNVWNEKLETFVPYVAPETTGTKQIIDINDVEECGVKKENKPASRGGKFLRPCGLCLSRKEGDGSTFWYPKYFMFLHEACHHKLQNWDYVTSPNPFLCENCGNPADAIYYVNELESYLCRTCWQYYIKHDNTLPKVEYNSGNTDPTNSEGVTK